MTNRAHPPTPASAVPAAFGARRGLAIGLAERAEGFVYLITLVGPHGAGEDRLLETQDECEAVKVWRHCARELGLPCYVERAPGDFVMVEARMGALAVRARKPRRRGSPLAARRPRLSLRRAALTRAEAPVHRDEREIIARD